MKSKKITRLLLLLAVFVMLFSFDALAVGLNRASVTLYPGQKVTLKLSGGKKVRWTTSSKKIATVKKKSTRTATVTAKKAGVVWITGTYKKKPYTCRVQVVDPSITGNAELKVPNTAIFTFAGPQSKKIKGKAVTWGKKGNTKKTLYWTISRKSVAELKPLSGGRVQVTPLKAGTATLRCRYAGKNYSLVLKVTDPAKDAEEAKKAEVAAKQAQAQAADASVWAVRHSAINYALSIANDNSWGYAYGWKRPHDTNCSRLVITAYTQAGIRFPGSSEMGYTWHMHKFGNYGFNNVTSSINLYTGAGLQPGDVLLKYTGNSKGGHTELVSRVDPDGTVYIVGARADYDGKTGDSSGNEISEMPFVNLNYNNMKWNYVWRYGTTTTSQPGTTVAASTPAPAPTTNKESLSGQYRVYVGPYTSQADAKKTVSELKEKKINAIVCTMSESGYIAQVGIFKYKENADRIAKTVKEAGYTCKMDKIP